MFPSTGYGFVDFDSPTSAQKAVTALKAGGVQAQMAKVRTPRRGVFGAFIPSRPQISSAEVKLNSHIKGNQVDMHVHICPVL